MEQCANKRTYYKRALPSPPAIAFSCAEGRQIFAEALQHGAMVGFFKLIEQFTTQEEPQYCGLAALSMTLNALGIDPRRTWKGAWRWFSETMLDCCKTMDEVKRDGITLSQAACLARCNGADVSVHRYGTFDGTTFRQLLREATSSEDLHMVVSYSRKTFKQSGDGHFSPIGGYHPERDLVLILDVARFKYAPHWVRVDELIEAMGLLDPAIGRPRGFLLMSCRTPRESALFSLDLSAGESGCAGPRPESTPTASLEARGSVSEPPPPPPPPSSSTCPHEPRWAAAYRFMTHDAGEVMRRLLADPDLDPNAQVAAGSGSTRDDDGHEEDAEEEEGEEGEDAGLRPAEGQSTSAASAGRRHTAAGGGVPSVEALVGALVAAAPLDSVCALLMRRPLPEAVGEVRKGPCCSCCLGGEAGGKPAAASAAGAVAAAAPSAASTAPPPLDLAPCNKSLCRSVTTKSGQQSQRQQQQVPQLTEAAVAAVQAAVAAVTDATAVCRVASQPPPSPLQRPPLRTPAAAAAAPYQASAPGGTAAVELGATANRSSSICGSSTSLSSRSDAASLDSAGPSDSSSFTGSLGSSHGCCSGGSGSSSGSSSGGGGVGGSSSEQGSSCCHGEPLEHHCVPPQVQAMVAGELRFTNMFKLVDYCLRRQRGCSHVREPDLTAFMAPAGAAAAATAAAAAATAAKGPAAEAAAAGTKSVSRGEAGACAAVAPAAVAATTPAPAAHAEATGRSGGAVGGGGGNGQACGEAAAGRNGGHSQAAGASECGCGDLGLMDLAAEKLTVALLLLSKADCWPEGETTDGTRAAAAPGIRQCGRPRCRKCRQRAAAAGDRAAAMELLRERWRQLLGMAPLGLFASAPILQDDLSYLRLQLSCLEQQRPQA